MMPAPKKENDAVSFAVNDKPIRYIGYAVLFVTLGLFGGWSFLAPIGSSVLAPGTITVKSHRKTVDNFEGGIVSQIKVKEGDVVKAGDTLVVLDDTQIKTELDVLRGQFISLSSFSARLKAERDKSSGITFPPELMTFEDPRVQEAIKDQQDVFITRRNSHTGETNVLKQRIEQLNSKIIGLKAQQASKNELRQSYAKEIKDLRELLDEGFVDKLRFNDLERNHTQLSGEIAQISAEIASSQMQIGEARIQIIQSESKFQEEVARQFDEVNQRLYDTTEKLHAATDRENRRKIIAPVSGIVFNLLAHTIGGAVAPGRPILEIVPENEDLMIHAQVSTVDIDKVKVGMKCEIRFSAFKSKTTPTMEGVVRKVSADSLVNEANHMSYYLAVVELNKDSYKKLKAHKLTLIPGMPAEVLINIGERTLFQYLVQPLTDAFARSFIEE